MFDTTNYREPHVFDPVHDGADECECGLTSDAGIHVTTTKPQSTTETLEPRLTFTVRWCPTCGRDDRMGTFKNAHYSRGELCSGVPITIEYSRSPATAAPVVDNDAVRRARDWLKSYEAEKYYEGIEGMFRYTAQLIDHLLAVIYATPRPASPTGGENRIRAALENIASQRLRSEIEPIDGEVSGDFEGAYDIMINVARDALAATAAPQSQSRSMIGSSRHPHFTAEDHQRMKETLDALSDYPTEEEAEAVLQACGTSGKEVVNEFIERLLKENLELKNKLATAAPVEQSEHDSCSHWREGDSDNCVWCGDDLGPTTEMDVSEEAR